MDLMDETDGELLEFICELIKNAGADGIDTDNSASFYLKIQKKFVNNYSAEKIENCLNSLVQGDFIEKKMNKKNIVYVLKENGMTVREIGKYYN